MGINGLSSPGRTPIDRDYILMEDRDTCTCTCACVPWAILTSISYEVSKTGKSFSTNNKGYFWLTENAWIRSTISIVIIPRGKGNTLDVYGEAKICSMKMQSLGRSIPSSGRVLTIFPILFEGREHYIHLPTSSAQAPCPPPLSPAPLQYTPQ